jgi:hypothetical protein
LVRLWRRNVVKGKGQKGKNMNLVEQIEKMDWQLSQKDPERHAEITATYEDMIAKIYTKGLRQ